MHRIASRLSETQRLLVVVLLFAAPLAPVSAHAEDEPGGRWQGTSWGFELRGGLSFRTQDEALTPAPILGGGFRICTLLTLIDAELFATTAGFSRTTERARYDLRRSSIGLDLRLHPLFVRHLRGGLADRIAAGLHLAIGLGADVLSIVGGSQLEQRDRTDVAFAFGIGLGLDLPLTEPNDRAWSLWLGLGWRLRFVGFASSAPGLGNMDEHQALVTLGVRFHDLTGVRFPAPPELDDADR